MKSAALFAAAGLAALAATSAAQERLFALNSSANAVMEFDPFDGTLLNPVFIDGNLVPGGWSTPKGIAQVEEEIWVADQVRDAIYRFDFSGAFISIVADPTTVGGLDNIRGLNFIDGIVYQTNAGTNNGAPGNAIVKFDANGNYLGFFTTIGSPFDIVKLNNQLIISDITNHRINAHNFDGTFNSTFHIGAIRFPQQIAFMAGGNLLVGGFSPPSGIYEIDQQGQQVNFIAASGVRGVHELGNGNIMYTNSAGVHIYDITTQFSTQVSTGGSQYIALIGEGEPPCYANCDGSTGEPLLTVDDFTCFINEFASAQTLPHEQQVTHYANCDGSTTVPALTVDDFTCFINAFAQGCD